MLYKIEGDQEIALTTTKNKTIIYIISKMEVISNTLVPLLVNQIIDSVVLYGEKERRLNIVMVLNALYIDR